MEKKQNTFKRDWIKSDTPPEKIWQDYRAEREAMVDKVISRISTFKNSKDSNQ